MDSKKLAAFLAVKASGSLTRAAEQMNYTQSGMTHMMNALEKELGVTLLRRGRNGVSLTPEAERLLPKIAQVVEAEEELDTEIGLLTGAHSAGIRVGAYSSMAQHWLPEIVHRFRTKFPEVDVSLQMGSIQEIYAQLKNGALDCAFVSYQRAEFTGALHWVPLHNDELVAVLPESYPVIGALFAVGGFDRADFLMPSNGFELDIAPMLKINGVRPNIRYTKLDDLAIISMVEHGLGISAMTELVMRGRPERVLSLPLTPPAYRELGIALQADRRNSRTVEHFVDCARTTVMEFYKT